MIQEDFCSFEVAKLLKEKGFDEPCFAYYNLFYDSKGKEMKLWRKFPHRMQPNSDYLNVPTHQMAMKWLREMHNVDIDIEAAVGMLGVKVYVPYISTYKPLEGASSKVCQIKRGIHYKDDHWVIPALQHFESYEEAIEAALKYSLEKLI